MEMDFCQQRVRRAEPIWSAAGEVKATVTRLRQQGGAACSSRYASHSDWAPQTAAPAAQRHPLNRWILSKLHDLAQ